MYTRRVCRTLAGMKGNPFGVTGGQRGGVLFNHVPFFSGGGSLAVFGAGGKVVFGSIWSRFGLNLSGFGMRFRWFFRVLAVFVRVRETVNESCLWIGMIA